MTGGLEAPAQDRHDDCPCGHDMSGFYRCINGRIYGPCSVEGCGGVCEDTYGTCTSPGCRCEEGDRP